MFAEIIERQLCLTLDLIVDNSRDVHLPGVTQAFQPSGHVHPVAVDVVPIHDDVAEVDPDPQFDPMAFGHVLIAPGEGTLDLDRAISSRISASVFPELGVKPTWIAMRWPTACSQ